MSIRKKILSKSTWARERKIKGDKVGNQTINRCITLFKRIYDDATMYYKWNNVQNPFTSFKKLPESDPYEKIKPFTVEEQVLLISNLPDHWKPYFSFAFASGIRQGEQIGLMLDDIEWDKGLIHIRRAITVNEAGHIIEGRTKNKYSRRTIKLIPVMMKPLLQQREIYNKLTGKYFFCSPTGVMIHPSNLRRRVWLPTLKKSNLEIRDMKQTRHSFATIALSAGENPLWIAKVMGHRNADMIINVYSKYVENVSGSIDGNTLNMAYERAISNQRE